MATTLADLSALKDLPFEMPPTGQSSNFINPENRGPAVVVVCYISIALMWPIYLLRLYSKAFVVRRIGWDDREALILLPRKLLNCDNSFCHTCCGMLPLIQIEGNGGAHQTKIGSTAFVAETIWSVEKHIAGPHAWDVRAINYMNVAVIKVSSALQVHIRYDKR
jgi:hypothetical protein